MIFLSALCLSIGVWFIIGFFEMPLFPSSPVEVKHFAGNTVGVSRCSVMMNLLLGTNTSSCCSVYSIFVLRGYLLL